MEKLISMTDFVLEQFNQLPELPKEQHMTKAYMNCLNYAQFLKQPLTLGMFVPCDDLGNVIKQGTNTCQYDFEVEQKAKERVLFEGFELVDGELFVNKEFYIYVEDLDCWRIEEVEGLFPESNLSPSALKQIGL